jgi:hypothetical protein
MTFYNPYNWYWLADDGRVCASARSIVTTENDSDYKAWVAAGGIPTPWPRDEEDEQTIAEMQRVLYPYNIAVDLKAYAFYARDQKEHEGMAITNLAPITETRTDDYTQQLVGRYHTVANSSVERGEKAGGEAKAEAKAGGKASGGGFTVAWILPDRSTTMLDKQKINSLYSQMYNFIASTYDTYSTVIAEIDSGTIITSGQIDAAFGVTLRRGAKKIDIGWKS